MTDLFLEHMAMVASAAKLIRPGVKMLACTDMMKTVEEEQLVDAGLDKLVQSVMWSCGQMLESYHTSQCGEYVIWDDSAWRGQLTPKSRPPPSGNTWTTTWPGSPCCRSCPICPV